MRYNNVTYICKIYKISIYSGYTYMGNLIPHLTIRGYKLITLGTIIMNFKILIE